MLQVIKTFRSLCGDGINLTLNCQIGAAKKADPVIAGDAPPQKLASTFRRFTDGNSKKLC
jgi:hypothetical protein